MKAQDFFIAFLLLLLGKIGLVLALRYLDPVFFGGGNDSYYYDAYARGYVDVALNSWPIMLRFLHEQSLYSRLGVSYFLTFLAFVFIPLAVGALCKVDNSEFKIRVYWAAAFLVSTYPTIIYLSMDIMRDIFMLSIWILGLFVYKALADNPSIGKRFFLILAGMFISLILFSLRDYLGFAYLLALIFSGFYSFKKYPFYPTLVLVIFALFAMFIAGLLDPIFSYRDIFEDMGGGSTMGIEFLSASSFLPDLFRSVAAQLFGLFFVNIHSVIAFLLESFPFIILIAYVVKYREFSNKFVDFLIVFFVAYACIWILGNDNLGTAVRLRTFNYLAVVIAFFVIYQNKKMACMAGIPKHKNLRFRLFPVRIHAHKSPALCLKTSPSSPNAPQRPSTSAAP